MKELYRFKYGFGLLVLFAFMMFTACKKEKSKPSDDIEDSTDVNPGPSQRLSDVDSLKFYIWWINESDSANIPLYYWYDQVPADFKWDNPDYKTGNDVMRAIASYPTYQGKKVDRYSVIDKEGEVAGELQGGVKGDYGYMVVAARDKEGKAHLFIEYTYKDSPAGLAGVSRGDEIVAIDGNPDMSLNSQANVDRINKALFSSKSLKLELNKPGSESTFTVDLQSTQYHLNPVLFDSVYTVAGKKVGYFVYKDFVSVVSGQNGTTARQEIDAAFSKFKAEEVDELIVDLRYNGGGAVPTAEYLDNLIAPSATVGQEMYKTTYNDALTDYYQYIVDNAADLVNNQDVKQDVVENAKDAIEPVDFKSESNNLNLSRVFFITSRGTASASELTINNLEPYMDVKLVGDTTYGKPVGFFGIPISFVTTDKGYQHVADMYAINFKSVNSEGKGDYFSGMVPDVQLFDYIDIPWGSDLDPRLASIFNKIEKGQFLTHSDFLRKIQESSQARKTNKSLPRYMRKAPSSVKIKNPHQFNGMVKYQKTPEVLLRK